MRIFSELRIRVSQKIGTIRLADENGVGVVESREDSLEPIHNCMDVHTPGERSYTLLLVYLSRAGRYGNSTGINIGSFCVSCAWIGN